MKRRLLISAVVIAVLGTLAWGAMRVIQMTAPDDKNQIPTTRVRKGRVTISVSARGELQGGNSEVLTGPMSDRCGRKWLIAGGMIVQAGGIWLTAMIPNYSFAALVVNLPVGRPAKIAHLRNRKPSGQR